MSQVVSFISSFSLNVVCIIVCINSGDQPTELYRTDFLNRMKQEQNSDSSSDEDDNFVPISDRWKEDWNYGVQVVDNFCI